MKTGLVEATLALAVAVGIPAGAGAQTVKYPERPVKILIGFSAGGGTDVVTRILAQKMSEGFGQPVVVENRPGVSGMTALQAVARSAPDGYTLMMGTQSNLAVAPILYRRYSLDPTRDVAGIALTGASPQVLVVHPAVPVKSVADVIAMAKTKPGTLNFGSGGLGTTPHMTGELFASVASIKVVHVAYRGEAAAMNDVLGGQIAMMFATLPAVAGSVKAGTLRALAVTSAQRAPAAPEIPTVAEAALPGFEAAVWFGLVAPAATPRDIVSALGAQVRRALAQPDVKQRFADLGMTIESSTPESTDAYIKSETAKWAKLIKDADIRAPD
ncbi:MAG TPA: tripartite tricarboxylate transporter substrate binding protein [Xanthobacteraceae bacterium]|jgi:tripartite-type tricarboxylate transporter receptor subunit TctC